MKRIMGMTLGVLAAFVGANGAACAAGSLVDVTVTDVNSGRALPVYAHRGQLYVPGAPGRRYAIEMENRTGERLLAVVSVDGVNVITGETASPEQSGYVLEPWGRTEIRGWRKSLSESAEFYFTELPDSYAARTDRPDNVGVIGIAVFRERPRPPALRPHLNYQGRESVPAAPKSESAAPAASADMQAEQATGGAYGPEKRARQELGTGHGERRYDPVDTTQFRRRSSRADELIRFFYDDRDTLVERGIIPRRHRRPRQPEAFPGQFTPEPWR